MQVATVLVWAGHLDISLKDLNGSKAGLWRIYHVGNLIGFGRWLQFCGSFGP